MQGIQLPMKDNIAVIGAGITGITTAYYLAKAGYSVSVYEAESGPAQPQATDRMRRNKRKNFMVSLLNRVWVKNPASHLICGAPNRIKKNTESLPPL